MHRAPMSHGFCMTMPGITCSCLGERDTAAAQALEQMTSRSPQGGVATIFFFSQ
jgi:hypothetical protein